MFATMLTAMSLALALTGGANFVSIGTKQGVEVYERKDTPVIELMAEGEINAPPEELQAVLLDYAAAPQFVHRLTESRVLTRSAREIVVYQRLKLPVIQDRDYFLRVTWGSAGDVRTTRFRTASMQGPMPPGVVRMALLEGGWDLQPIRDGHATWARYHFRIDFSGSVPRWMVRGGAAKDLPALYAGLRHMVGMRRAAAMALPKVQQVRW
jgi:hypothetical protein